MEPKERRALDKCFDSISKDLDPSLSLLQSLCAERILTEEMIDKIEKMTSRPSKVALLLKYLPQRGPKAFTIFCEKISRDYSWLAKELKEEKERLPSGQATLKKQLIGVIQSQLVPLVYPENAAYVMCDKSADQSVIIQQLRELLTRLERQCYKSLDVQNGSDKIPIHKLIDERLNQATLNKRLIRVIQSQLVPLVYPENAAYEMCDKSADQSVIIQKLRDLLTRLEQQCYKSLRVQNGSDKIPIHKLIDERLNQATLNERLIRVIKSQLVPLVYQENAAYEMWDKSEDQSVIIQKLRELLTRLEQKCYKSLDVQNGSDKIPIHKLIDMRLKQQVKKEAACDLEDLRKEVRDLKKQLKEHVKLKGENEKLRQITERQKEKLKDYAHMKREVTKHKQNIDKYKKESEALRFEVSCLKEQQKYSKGIFSLY